MYRESQTKMKRIVISFIVVVAITVSAVVVTSCSNIQTQGGGSTKSERWEYKGFFVNLSTNNEGQLTVSWFDGQSFSWESRPLFEVALDNLGKEGWELVSVSTPLQHSSDYLFTFKRRLP